VAGEHIECGLEQQAPALQLAVHLVARDGDVGVVDLGQHQVHEEEEAHEGEGAKVEERPQAVAQVGQRDVRVVGRGQQHEQLQQALVQVPKVVVAGAVLEGRDLNQLAAGGQVWLRARQPRAAAAGAAKDDEGEGAEQDDVEGQQQRDGERLGRRACNGGEDLAHVAQLLHEEEGPQRAREADVARRCAKRDEHVHSSQHDDQQLDSRPEFAQVRGVPDGQDLEELVDGVDGAKHQLQAQQQLWPGADAEDGAHRGTFDQRECQVH